MKPHDYQKELKQAFQERYRALLIKYQFRRIWVSCFILGAGFTPFILSNKNTHPEVAAYLIGLGAVLVCSFDLFFMARRRQKASAYIVDGFKAKRRAT